MGTHPIFESDFDCLTEHARVVATTGNDVATHHSSPTSHCPAVAYHDGIVASLSRLFRLSTGGGSLGAEEALVQWSQRRFPAPKVASHGIDDGMGKYSAAQKRIQIFQQEPGQTAILEDLPMWWMLDPMSETEKEAMKTEHRIDAWKENMYKRGFELPRRPVDEGPVFRYRTAQQQKVARKKRLQIQYENHFIRLRALSKNNLLPAAMVNEAAEYKWMLQNGRFAELRGFDREARSTVCRLHGRMVSVRPRWACVASQCVS